MSGRRIDSIRNFNLSTKDFRRVALLGTGSFGEVFLVERLRPSGEKSGKFYAMKRMKKRDYSGGLTRLVITEKEVARTIDHQFVIKLNYAFQSFDYLYLITEFCPGGDMRSIIS